MKYANRLRIKIVKNNWKFTQKKKLIIIIYNNKINQQL